MIDIIDITDDIKTYDTSVTRAENVLSVQLGSLDYAPDFGVDLRYFLSEEFEFQNDSFKAYLLQRLAEHSIDVFRVTETVENLFTQFGFGISAKKTSTGLVR